MISDACLDLLHRLWTRAVGTPGYVKNDWKEMERLLRQRPDVSPYQHKKPVALFFDLHDKARSQPDYDADQWRAFAACFDDALEKVQ